MQKWEKFLLVSLFILAILGSFIGFAITQFRLGEVKVLANINLATLSELFFLVIVVACGIFDTYETLESKKQFGTSKFELILNTRNRFRNALIFLALVTLLEFDVFLYSIDFQILPLFFISLILTLIFAFHSTINNGIGENGILYWGFYYNWDDVQSHNIVDEKLLELNVINNFFTLKYSYKIKFNFDEKDRQEIEKFLTERLAIPDKQLN